MNKMHWKSILLYMSSSFFIVVFNKIILTGYSFPSIAYLMLWQSVLSTVFFWFKSKQKLNISILPVCLINIANIFLGLNAAGNLNVAMFTALRRVSIFVTMVSQWYFLNKSVSKPVVVSVIAIIVGAFIAAIDDLTFDAAGYAFAMANNILTAASQIATKKAMQDGWEKETILFCTSFVMAIVSYFTSQASFQTSDFEHWGDIGFQVAYVGSMTMGLIINWAVAWVIEENDALTLAIAGSTKAGLLSTLVCAGILDPTYVFSMVNFVGLQISMCASFTYVYYAKAKRNNE